MRSTLHKVVACLALWAAGVMPLVPGAGVAAPLAGVVAQVVEPGEGASGEVSPTDTPTPRSVDENTNREHSLERMQPRKSVLPAGAEAPESPGTTPANPAQPSTPTSTPANSSSPAPATPGPGVPFGLPGLLPARSPTVNLDKPLFVMEPLAQPVRAGSEVVLRFRLLALDGQPLGGALVGANVDHGRILSVREMAPGLQEVTLQVPQDMTETRRDEPRREEPPRPTGRKDERGARGGTAASGGKSGVPKSSESSAKAPALNLTLSTSVNGTAITQSFSLPVRLSVEGWLKLTASTDRIKLGRVREVRLLLQGQLADGKALRPEAMELRTTGGRVERLRALPDGGLEAWYVPDERNIPQAVIVAAFTGEGREQLRAWTVLRLIATPEVPVNTEPGARVWVEVGGTSYGPVVAGADGQARIAVTVSPGVRAMNIRVMDRVGNSSRTTQSLAIPRSPLSIMRFDRNEFRRDEDSPLLLTLLRIDDDGTPSTEFKGRLEGGKGGLGGLVQESPGMFSTTWMPPSTVGPAEVVWSIPLPEGGEERFSASVEVQEGIARRLEFSVRPDRLRTDDPPAEVSLKVFDRHGNPATSVSPRVAVPIGTVEPLRRIGPGEFITAYRPPENLDGLPPSPEGRYPVPVSVEVQRLPGPGPVVDLRFETSPIWVPSGGAEVSLRVLARNRWGAPVKAVSIQAQVQEGDGSISSQAVTDEQGMAEFKFYPGLKVGGVTVQVSTEEVEPRTARALVITSAVLPAAPVKVEPATDGSTVATSPNLVESGNPSLHADGSDTELKQTVTLTLVPGRVRRVELVAFPNVLYLSTNQSSDLTVRLMDHAGNLVEDPGLRLYASMGSVSTPRKSSRGNFYEAHYVPPPIALNENRARLTATNAAGEYVGSTEVELIRSEGRFITSARVGAITNFGAVRSPVLGFQALSQMPWLKSSYYIGFAVSYYAFESDSVRVDLAPVQAAICYRRNLGAVSPFVLFGPMLVPMSVQRDIVGGADAESLRAWHVGPGVSTRLGMEYQVGLGGLSLEADLSLIRAGQVPSLGLDLTQNLGGLAVMGGYVAHF